MIYGNLTPEELFKCLENWDMTSPTTIEAISETLRRTENARRVKRVLLSERIKRKNPYSQRERGYEEIK